MKRKMLKIATETRRLRGFLLFLISVPLCLCGSLIFAQATKPDKTYLTELNVRGGIHMTSESDEWDSTRQDTLKNNVFFKEREFFNSQNVADETAGTQSAMVPYLSFEALWGIKLGQLPGLKSIQSLKGFRGFRVGVGFHLYPFMTQESINYNDKIVFKDPGASDVSLTTKDYKGQITMNERALVIAQSLNLYYYYEKGFGKQPDGLPGFIPYAGIEIGFGFITGKRKLKVSTEPLNIVTAADGSNDYTVDANIQETFFNAIATRIAPVLGMQYHLMRWHFLDLRFGFTLQKATAKFDRTGTFTETATKPDGTTLYTYSEKANPEKAEASFNMTGIQISLGYTAGIK